VATVPPQPATPTPTTPTKRPLDNNGYDATGKRTIDGNVYDDNSKKPTIDRENPWKK
jgi:hypothetical protein